MHHIKIVNQFQPDHAFRTKIPNVVMEIGLSLPAIGLYTYFKRISGDSGACFKSKTTLCKELSISPATYRKYRDELAKPQPLCGNKPLIQVHIRKKDDGSHSTTVITLVDIWREKNEKIEEAQPCH